MMMISMLEKSCKLVRTQSKTLSPPPSAHASRGERKEEERYFVSGNRRAHVMRREERRTAIMSCAACWHLCRDAPQEAGGGGDTADEAQNPSSSSFPNDRHL